MLEMFDGQTTQFQSRCQKLTTATLQRNRYNLWIMEMKKMDAGILTGSLLCAALKQSMATKMSQATDQGPNLVDDAPLH